MADIRPFRGVRYDGSLGNPADLICPPYDIISPEEQQALYRRSQYNFVRIEYNLALPGDNETSNRYTRARAALEEWLKAGVLKQDERPAVYLHDHGFTHGDRKLTRRGVIAAVRLEDWDKGVVRPHEDTMPTPKSDRLNLLASLQANTSGIMALYDRPELLPVLEAGKKAPPAVRFQTSGETHELWPITGGDAVAAVRAQLAAQPLYIADGHHRYESALAYARQRRAGAGEAEMPSDFVMMTLIELHDPGLVILPTHRLARGIPAAQAGAFPAKLRELFEVAELPDSAAGWEEVDRRLSASGPVRLVVFGALEDRTLVLTARDPSSFNGMMPGGHSEIYKSLDVSLVDHVILDKLLGITRERQESSLGYTHDRQEAAGRVRIGEYRLAFIMGPVRAGTIKAVADAGDRMPRKSSYFYPKLPSGLVVYRFGNPAPSEGV
ncbi:MAG: DUF1015 domain-containing protein [Chloroflexi bacterium]|nr:DUF1015 domain-containing protein [Chloroflexota bacterium]